MRSPRCRATLVQGKQAWEPRFGEELETQRNRRYSSIRDNALLSSSGETSWLARRIGQTPEAGQDQPTPWVHSDVLALIARDGLAMSPNEVEL